MEKYFVMYQAPYGLTVESLGEFAEYDAAVEKAEHEHPEPVYVLDESELRGFMGSVQNVLKNS